MNSVNLPKDCAKQWEILLLLLSSEEKKIDRTNDSEIDTMNYFLKNEGVRKILLQWLRQMQATYAKKTSESDTALKCDEVSLLWRQRGNDKFRANCVEDSYKCYTKSVLYATQNGPMYPLALANRSASLLRMKRFKECLSDVAMALDSGYPHEQRHKLLLRRADCLLELGDAAAARLALHAAAAHAGGLRMSDVHASELDRHMKLLEKKLEAVEGEGAGVVAGEGEEDELPGCHLGDNQRFTAASNAVELRCSETAGRHVVTAETARRGDVLFSEAPYAWVTLPGEDHVCAFCCRAHVNCVPCARCSRAIYCGEACRARAHAGFHRWECAGAQADLFPTIGIAHLALRVLLISASEGFPLLPQSVPEPTTAAELFQGYARVDNVQIYSTDTPPFYRMFNLVTNFDKMNNTDYIQYALTATLLTLYLETSTSFLEYAASRLPYALCAAQRRLFAAAVLLRSVGQLVCNGHAALSLATVDDHPDNGGTLTEREVRRATAIYPSAAMMNHSCDPNIINTFHNSRLIIRCARELPAGAEVLNCYGPHRAREPAPRRRAALRAQYMFTCACAACTDTERKDFALVFSAYACQQCRGPWGRGRAAALRAVPRPLPAAARARRARPSRRPARASGERGVGGGALRGGARGAAPAPAGVAPPPHLAASRRRPPGPPLRRCRRVQQERGADQAEHPEPRVPVRFLQRRGGARAAQAVGGDVGEDHPVAAEPGLQGLVPGSAQDHQEGGATDGAELRRVGAAGAAAARAGGVRGGAAGRQPRARRRPLRAPHAALQPQDIGCLHSSRASNRTGRACGAYAFIT